MRSTPHPAGRRPAACLLTVLAAGLGFLTPPAAGEPEKPVAKKPTLGDVIDRAAESVVRVSVTDGSGEPAGLGTGFVLDAKGRVATNYHVTRRGAKVVVEFRDGTKCDVKGYHALDKEGDIAVLELAAPPKKVRPLPLGPKTPPRQGDGVIAIGHPQGLNFTVTTGIVSAVRKTSELPKEIRERVQVPADRVWVQTSAPISPGNSGGPLLDDDGRVVGINTWIADGQNLGFGVHVSHLLDLLDKAPAKTLPLVADASSSRDTEEPLNELQPRNRELLKEYQKAEAEFRTLLGEARSEAEARKLWDAEHPGPKFARRFYEVATSDRGTLTAFQALCLACRFDAGSKDAAVLPKALERLAKDHAADKGMQQALPLLVRTGHPAVADFLRQVIARSPHRRVRALGSFYLALVLTSDSGGGDEAPKLLEACLKEYKDEPLGDKKLGELAGPLLFRAKYLSVGRKAPDVSGADVEGKQFKLSDFRGKVVLLDFFADWCPHCVRMYPHERKLVQEYAGRPFAIVGVNSDGKDTLRQLQADKKVTWRCWSDGEHGPIAREWQIEAYPMLFLLDHRGVIRHVFAGRPEEAALDKAVKELVEEAAKAGPEKPAPGK